MWFLRLDVKIKSAPKQVVKDVVFLASGNSQDMGTGYNAGHPSQVFPHCRERQINEGGYFCPTFKMRQKVSSAAIAVES